MSAHVATSTPAEGLLPTERDRTRHSFRMVQIMEMAALALKDAANLVKHHPEAMLNHSYEPNATEVPAGADAQIEITFIGSSAFDDGTIYIRQKQLVYGQRHKAVGVYLHWAWKNGKATPVGILDSTT